MGGMGSGRGHQGGKRTTASLLRLDVRLLQRKKWLTPGRTIGLTWLSGEKKKLSVQMQAAEDHVTLTYHAQRNDGDWETMEYPVYLEWTACHLGGQRAWFRCPVRGCGRRVAILFGGQVFACRHCHNLAYQSQREKCGDRAMWRANSIRARLGWGAGIANSEGCKPKGMHWRTFNRLIAQYAAFANRSWASIGERLRRCELKLNRDR